MPRQTETEMLNIKETIAALRRRTEAHKQVILGFEEYSRQIAGTSGKDEESKTGRANGYAAEIAYLRLRKSVLDELIASVEKYQNTAVPQFSFPTAA